MAVAKATPTVSLVDNTQKIIRVYGTLAVGASPLTYAALGIPCSFANIDDIKSNQTPLFVHVKSKAATASEVVYKYVPGTDPSNGVLQAFVQDGVATNPLLEVAAGAMPASISGDTIAFVADFKRDI